MITCAVDYVIDPQKIAAFEGFGRRWIDLVTADRSSSGMPGPSSSTTTTHAPPARRTATATEERPDFDRVADGDPPDHGGRNRQGGRMNGFRGWIAAMAAGVRSRLASIRPAAGRRVNHGRLAARRDRVGGLTLHARVSVGSVPDDRLPVILVHGLGMSSRYMIPLAEHLAPHLRVYAPDLPGFGLSDKPPRALTVRQLADALAAWMQELGLERAAFVGNSLGCEVLVELALVHPQRVDRLVLQGPTPDPEARGLARQIAGFFLIAPFERGSLAWVALTDYARSGVRRYLRTLKSMIDNHIGEKALRVSQPTLVVWGTRDHIVPYEFVTRLAASLPRGRLAVIPGAAHGINYSHPEAFTAVLLPFLLAPQERPPAEDSSKLENSV